MNALLAQAGKAQTFWMPEQASTFAGEIDFVFYFIYWVCVVFFVVIAGCMFWFMWKYRMRTEDDAVGTVTHHTGLEVAWSVLPSFLLVLMFWWGLKGFMALRTIPANTYDVNVDAQKWSWLFKYPTGADSSELHVPVNQPIKLSMYSKDVLHACFIPVFRVKQDIVPGRVTHLWFQATKTGEFPLYCAEYCGQQHSDMRSKVVVHDQKGFDEWLKTADPLAKMTPEQVVEYIEDPAKFKDKYKDDPILSKLDVPSIQGRKLYEKKGCKGCHTVDGKPHTGPTWKGLYGKSESLRDGSSVQVDDNYIRESILEPNKRITAGFNPVMPRAQLKDSEIQCLIEYIKTLK